ncbi:MAG: hypothetical protein KatS3mg104_1327 [Phycisphaerae bacterium]|nr:MAG: hypothetical protein KatS3mg104_1327 [Phycisphaerae bacterium]
MIPETPFSNDPSVVAPPRKLDLFGVGVSATTYEQVVEYALSLIRSERSGLFDFMPVHGLIEAVRDPCFREAIRAFDVVGPDGQPVRWGLNLLHQAGLIDRVYGPTCMFKLCQAAQTHGIGIYLYGATPDVLDALEDRLKREFPRLRICGKESPPFRPLTEEEDAQAVARINASGAGMLFLGLGCPKQELFAYAHRDRIKPVQFCVGAAFDFHAGTKKNGALMDAKTGPGVAFPSDSGTEASCQTLCRDEHTLFVDARQSPAPPSAWIDGLTLWINRRRSCHSGWSDMVRYVCASSILLSQLIFGCSSRTGPSGDVSRPTTTESSGLITRPVEVPPDDPIIATAGKTVIRESEFLVPLKQAYGLNVLMYVVQRDLAMDVAREMGLTVTESDIAQERDWTLRQSFPKAETPEEREKLLDQLLNQPKPRENMITRTEFDIMMQTNAAMRKIAQTSFKDAISEEQLKQQFDRQYGASVKVRFIMLANIQEVQKVQRMLASRGRFC